MFLTKTFTAGNETYEEFPFLGELIMEAFLIENPKALNLGAEDFEEAVILGHQIKLEEESQNKEGRIDILAAYGNRIAIIELKKGLIDENALNQLNGYLKVRHQLEDYCIQEPWLSNLEKSNVKTVADYCDGVENIEWVGILAGTEIKPELAVKLRNGEFNSNEDQIPIAGITINRFTGEKNRIYTITDSFLPKKVNGKDYTKYNLLTSTEIIGEALTKNRLALNIVQYFVKTHNGNLTKEQLFEAFDNNIQGSATIVPYEDSKDRRSFKKPDQVIILADYSRYCVSTQWGKGNIGRMINRAKELMSELQIISIPNN